VSDSGGAVVAATRRTPPFKIYRQIGYEPVCDVDQYGFG
jgi:hypothetical protein